MDVVFLCPRSVPRTGGAHRRIYQRGIRLRGGAWTSGEWWGGNCLFLCPQPEGLEGEAEAEVDRVMEEITAGLLAPAGSAPTTAPPAAVAKVSAVGPCTSPAYTSTFLFCIYTNAYRHVSMHVCDGQLTRSSRRRRWLHLKRASTKRSWRV